MLQGVDRWPAGCRVRLVEVQQVGTQPTATFEELVQRLFPALEAEAVMPAQLPESTARIVRVSPPIDCIVSPSFADV